MENPKPGNDSSYWDSQGEWHVCVRNDRNSGSYGVFIEDNPFGFVLPVTLCQLFTFNIISRTLYFLLRPLRTPKFICNLLGGIVLGPTFLGRCKAYRSALFPERQATVLLFAYLLGAIYFLFLVSLKMDVLMTVRAAKSTWRLGVIPVFVSFIALNTLLSVFYAPKISPSYIDVSRVSISFAMALSNFPVISDALIELNLIATELGQISLSSSMINDNMQWLLIIVHSFTHEADLKDSINLLGKWSLFICFIYLVLRPTVKLIVRITPVGKPVKETYVVFILLTVLLLSALGDVMGVSVLMGPLLFGLVIPSGPPLGTTLVEKSEILITQFMLPFFFMYVGMMTDLSALRDWRLFLTLQTVFIVGDLAKLVACILVSITYNIKPRYGTLLGLTLNIKGLTQLIGFARLKKLKMLDEDTFSQLVFCVVVITMIITPLIGLLYRHRPRVLQTASLYEGCVRSIQSIPRDAEFRIICCVHNEENVRCATAFIEVCNPVLESPICLYAIHLIELLGKSAPILIPINYRLKSLSVNYPNTNHIMRAFENYSDNSSGPVTVIPYVNVAPYKSMHDAICNLAQDKLVPFIIVPFPENDNVHLVHHVAASIRKMTASFQAQTPCTLGILVDKHSRLSACNVDMFFNVGIFFIGGADDREALALGIRMGERATTRVSLFRFVVRNREYGNKIVLTREEREQEEEDLMMDEGLIDEFKSLKYGSGNVSWFEITVEDGVEVLDAVHSLEGNYDLVMVGKRHNDGYLNSDQLETLIENAAILGILGDMLSSPEFCLGMIPVLVTQCGEAGVLLGPTCFGHDEAFLGTLFPLKQALVMNTLAKIGTIYCVFLKSLKMDVLTTLKSAKRCWRFGVFPFFASFFVTATMLSLYSPHGADRDKNIMSMYNFPNVFTLSSFAVISEILMELNLLATELGRIALSSAMISEILQWCTMELEFNTNLSAGFIVVLLAGAFGFGLLCVAIVRPLVNIIVEKTVPGEPMKEAYVVALLLGPLVMAAISDSLGVFFVAGPLLYGFILPNGPPVATTIIERVELIVSEFFMPFFYMYVGKRTDLSGLHEHWEVALTVQGILFLGCVVKVVACALISPSYKIKPKHGVVLGLILNVKGVVELIFYSRMNKLGVIDTEVYSVAVMYVVLITAVCVPSIKILYRHCRVCITPTVQEGRVRTIQNCKPNTEFNIVSCVHTDQHVHSMIALTEACNPTLESPICLFVIHLIELSGKSTPILLPMSKNNRKSLSVNYPNTNRILRAYENYSENSSGPVTVLSYVNVAPYKSMHEAVCNLAEDNSVHLLIIPFHQNDQSLGIHVCSIFRELNENFAANSKGTLGILVDRFSVLSMSNYKMPFHVGIFFVGGEDDREALALGIRMLERANTRVTLIRFVLLRKGDSGFLIFGDVQNEEDTLESTLNESLIDEFLAKKDYSFDVVNVVYHEVVVEDCIQVLEAIRVMENDYDLVMVGKQHSMGDFREEEMSNLMDNSDQLGILGDMLSSSEFCEGKTPVLVMKSGVKRVKQLTNAGRHIFRSA